MVTIIYNSTTSKRITECLGLEWSISNNAVSILRDKCLPMNNKHYDTIDIRNGGAKPGERKYKLNRW